MSSIPDSKSPKGSREGMRGLSPAPPVRLEEPGQNIDVSPVVRTDIERTAPANEAATSWGDPGTKGTAAPREVESVFTTKSNLVRAITGDLEASLQNVIEYVKDPERFTPATAERDLKVMYALMLAAKPEQVNLAKLAQPGHARAAIDKAFELQQVLGQKLAAFGDEYVPEIADQMRNVDRGLHYLGDTVLLNIPGAPIDGSQPELATEIPDLHWTADPGYQSLDKMPDVFFVSVDGGSEVSDTIKTATAVDAFVSHLAIVIRKRDPATGKVTYWVAEATSGRGVYVHPLDPLKWFQSNVRSMIHVPADTTLQAAFNAAAPKWIDEAYRRQEAGDPIPYNFAMDLNDDTKTMCTQLPLQITQTPEFKAVMADKAIAFPKFRSRLQTGETVREILNEWDIKGFEMLAPGDFTIDPMLKLVATSRTLPGGKAAHDINRGHMRSAVFSTVFNDWMQKKNYRLHISTSWRFAAAVALAIRRTPFVGDFLLGDKLQPHVRPGVIASIMDLGSVTSVIYNSLEKVNDAYFQSKGRYMTFEEMNAALEKIRLDDLARYEKWTTWTKRRNDRTAQNDLPHFSLNLEPPRSLIGA